MTKRIRLYEMGYEGSDDPAHYIDVDAPRPLLPLGSERTRLLREMLANGWINAETYERLRGKALEGGGDG